VVTASGEEVLADYVVLATGSSYPFPAKTDKVNTDEAHDQVRAAHLALSRADRVLLLGAGPVGIELAGEIDHVWPEKSVTLLDVAGEILGGPFKPELKPELRRQLAEIVVEMVLGSPLKDLPPTAPEELGAFTVTTEEGLDVTADIWFRCFRVAPNSDYLGAALLPARQADGFVQVEPTLQVVGQTTVFALGDRSTADIKMAAGRRPPAARPRRWRPTSPRLATGSEPTAYQSMGTGIGIPIGSQGGAGQFPGQDEIVGADVISDVKGRDMMVDRFQELLGLAVAAID